MGISSGPNTVERNLLLYLDIGNNRSFPNKGSGIITDLSGNGKNATLQAPHSVPTFSHENIETGAVSGGGITTDGEYIIHTFYNL